jgi:hypothetical protein
MGDNIITANIGIYIIQIMFIPVIIKLFHWGNTLLSVIVKSGFTIADATSSGSTYIILVFFTHLPNDQDVPQKRRYYLL